jgi:hypothetical protein
MEVGPILGVRPVTMVKTDRPSPDLSRVFEAEYLGDASEDAYSHHEGDAEEEMQEGEEIAGAIAEAQEPAGPPDSRGSKGPDESDESARSVDCFA